MKNKTVKMVIAVAVLVVCCGAYAGVKTYVAKQEQKESEEETEEKTTVFSASADDIQSLDFMIDKLHSKKIMISGSRKMKKSFL